MTTERHTVLVRMSHQIAARLEREGSEPVHVLAVERHEDGTADLVLRTPEPDAEFKRLRDRTIGWLALHVTQGDRALAISTWNREIFADAFDEETR